ncbi:DUF3365 domain-containing protein [Sulfurimonas sp. SAG-AH-194-I05]|nr:ATP-binding protein [Sulfurimonas sp. SAG-AH-194-I05]MDF1875382.1 DUF3365 domain-containing protein [Sulfurimonas sp. SAG-AH-194-I05]
MKNLFNKIFKETMLGAIVITISVMFAGILYLVPLVSKDQAKEHAIYESEQLTNYIRIFRSYYANNILKKIKAHTDLKVNYDHKLHAKTVPLPATLVHDLGALFTAQTNTSLQMYSNFPFPNRKERVLDTYQKDALAYILKNPDKSFSREDIINGEHVYRTAIGDFLSAQSCVNCHNSRADTPKTDWKLGDMRGVIEVTIPMETSSGLAQNLTYSILAFIFINLILLGLYYFLQIKRKNKQLKKEYTKKDKILSEYKRAVDMGTIVSKADKNGTITYVNDAFVEISGYSRAELIGKPHAMIRHEDMPQEIFADMWSKILNKEVWQGDIKNKTKHAGEYYVHATIIPILDENDALVEFLAIRYDTTSLHQAIKTANAAEKTKGEFLANMSHELRTPLNAIIGFSQIIQRRKKADEKDATYISKIQLSGQNLLTLVDSILDFSKIEEGKMEFLPSEIDIFDLFTEVSILIESQAFKKNIKITLNGFNKGDTLFADKQLLKQALLNILSNSVKFTPENGKITISYKKENKKHLFSIEDNGIGIAPDDLENIFMPFKQGTSAKRTEAKGTGLGLAITNKIITELHNGTIHVQSEENKGTCFYISL